MGLVKYQKHDPPIYIVSTISGGFLFSQLLKYNTAIHWKHIMGVCGFYFYDVEINMWKVEMGKNLTKYDVLSEIILYLNWSYTGFSN